eukprot:m51a1_g5940 putative rho gtpase-activating protein 39-like (627) ;mRNA; r:116439-118822
MSNTPETLALLGSWKDACDELDRKTASAREACRALERRAADARRVHGVMEDTARRLPSRLWNEETTTNEAWAALYESQKAHTRAAAALSDRLSAEHRRLSALADSMDRSSARFRSRGESMSSEVCEALSKVSTERERLSRLCREREQARAAERASDSTKRRSRAQADAERLASDAAVCEAQYKLLQANARDTQDRYRTSALPNLLTEIEEVLERRLTEMRAILVGVAEAETAWAASLSSPASALLTAACASDVSSDMAEMRQRLYQRASASEAPVDLIESTSSPAVSPCVTPGSACPDSPPARSAPQRILSVFSPRIRTPKTPVPTSQSPPEPSSLGYAVLKQLVERVIELGGPRTELVFRLSVERKVADAAMEAFEARGDLPSDVHVAAVLLKQWLATRLPDPVIPTAQYEAAIDREEPPTSVYAAMPEPNKSMLAYVVRFIQTMARPECVARTKMPLPALCTCLAPCLMRGPQSLSAAQALYSANRESHFLAQLVIEFDSSSSAVSQSSGSPRSLTPSSPTVDANSFPGARSSCVWVAGGRLASTPPVGVVHPIACLGRAQGSFGHVEPLQLSMPSSPPTPPRQHLMPVAAGAQRWSPFNRAPPPLPLTAAPSPPKDSDTVLVA